jgi:hypothetical protein
VALTDSNGLPDSDGIIFGNDAQTQIQMMFIKRRRSFFLQEATRDITSTEIIGGSAPGKFLFPSDMWFLESIQYNSVDTTNPSLYKPCRQINAANLQNGKSIDWVRNNQDVNAPLVDIRGDWFEILPTPSIIMSKAVKIFYYLQETDFQTTGDTIAYPFSLNYYCLSYMIGSIYCTANKDFDLAAELEKKAQAAVDMVIDMIESGMQTPLRPQGLGITGWQY